MVVLPGEGRGGRLLATLMSESFDLRRFKSGDLIGVLEVDIGVAVLLLQGSTTLIGAGEEALGGSAGPEGTGGRRWQGLRHSCWKWLAMLRMGLGENLLNLRTNLGPRLTTFPHLSQKKPANHQDWLENLSSTQLH